jgi:hypothetical protein
MGLLSRIPCAPRPSGRSLRVLRRRKPDLESLEGRTLLSGNTAALSPMPQALIPNPAANIVGLMGATPESMVLLPPRTAVAD